MSSGKAVRLNRILGPDGKTVIAALDHGIAGISPLAALEKLERLIPELCSAGVDALIVTPGTLGRFGSLCRDVGIIVRVDCGPTALTAAWSETRPVLSVEDALRLGADAVIAMGIVGAVGESASLQSVARLAGDCARMGIPFIAEMLPGGFAAADSTPEQISAAARVGAELGADIIKIRYSGNPESFQAVTSCCFRPIVVLGGSKQNSQQLLSSTRDAISAGAAGVAVGRNIWQSDRPHTIGKLLVEAVHG